MLDFTPDPVAFQLGPLPVYWYGIGYARGSGRRLPGHGPAGAPGRRGPRHPRQRDDRRRDRGADRWARVPRHRPVGALPGRPDQDLPAAVFGSWASTAGSRLGTIAAFLYARYKGLPFLRWADIVAPGLFMMQAIARWGNFFNQELYGTPTTLPWGIPIDCAHRIAAYPCGAAFPETTLFHPLFLYESLSGLLGAARPVWLGFHARKRLRPGDLLLSSSSGTASSASSSRRSARTTGRSSGSRRRRSCRCCSSSRRC